MGLELMSEIKRGQEDPIKQIKKHVMELKLHW